MRFAYADPPYPGRAGYYEDHPDFAGEVDHEELIERLERDYPDGWALSTAASSLREILPLCPRSARVCAWNRRAFFPAKSKRPLSSWEPLIVARGREYPTAAPRSTRDALAYHGRFNAFPGALIGMKPPQFSVWMFQQLGAGPGDSFDDLFPGSGAVARAWESYTSLVARAASE